MKKHLPLIAGIALLLLVIVALAGAYAYLSFMQEPIPAETETAPSFPSSGVSTGYARDTRSIALASGETIAVNDFIDNGITYADPMNEGAYFLAGSVGYCAGEPGCPDTGTPDFSILYLEADQTFIVNLDAEPLGESRRKAERYLADVLGISATQLCALSYTVGTTYALSPTYGSITNLGFSECPGAIALP